jgi:hypothetical protein
MIVTTGSQSRGTDSNYSKFAAIMIMIAPLLSSSLLIQLEMGTFVLRLLALERFFRLAR